MPRAQLAPRVGEQAPHFRATLLEGRAFDSWQARQRTSVLILLPEPGWTGHESLAARLLPARGDIAWLETHILVAADGCPEAASLHSPPHLLLAPDAGPDLRRTLGLAADGAAALLLDRHGALYAQWHAGSAAEWDIADQLATIRLMQSECPECGDRCWSDLA